jgi:hypothetical protein
MLTAMRRALSRVRTSAAAIGILIFGLALGHAQVQNNQQNGQWCAYFSDGSTNCGFAAVEECLEAIRGKSGLCDRTPQYVSPTESHSPSSAAIRRQ